MSERKAKARRRPVPASSNGEPVQGVVEAPQPEASPSPVQHPSVLVMRVPGDQPGQERIEIVELNGTDPLATPTMLRLAANIRQQQLGL